MLKIGEVLFEQFKLVEFFFKIISTKMKITGTYVCIVFDVEMCLVVDSQVSGLPQRMYQIDLKFLI